MAKSSISMVLLLASSVGFVLSNPLLNQFNNLPRCLQPQATGLCLAYFPRYYYNSATDSCDTFVYGGCNGNENNFWSLEECEKACKGFKPATTDFKLFTESDVLEEKSVEQEPQQQQSVEDPCALPVETGECRAAMPRLFYNAATNECEQFLYGGCNGNANNFVTIEECKQRCSNSVSSDDASLPSQDATKVEEPEAESIAENE